MKTRRFDFNHKPLQITRSFVVDGSVPGSQNYNADADEYTPDYTLTPLIIQPHIGRMDKDEILASGPINIYLTNVRWSERIGGTSTIIGTTNPDYEITTAGSQAGRIKVKKNATPNNPITLGFFAQYTDTRTNQIYTIQDTFLVSCKNSTEFVPQLYLDAADQTIYNPLHDEETQTVHASLRCGESECEAANRIFVWEVWKPGDNAWQLVTADEVMNYHIAVSNDGTSCTVNRQLMGGECFVRCRAKYDINGNPASVTLTEASPSKIIAFVRRIPKFDFDMLGVPYNIPPGILEVVPEAYITDTNGPISNPEKELLPLWYIATNKASGSLSYSLVAHGKNPVIKTTAMSEIHGAVIGLDVKDRGPVAAWEDSDGKIFTDSDGKILLIH